MECQVFRWDLSPVPDPLAWRPSRGYDHTSSRAPAHASVEVLCEDQFVGPIAPAVSSYFHARASTAKQPLK